MSQCGCLAVPAVEVPRHSYCLVLPGVRQILGKGPQISELCLHSAAAVAVRVAAAIVAEGAAIAYLDVVACVDAVAAHVAAAPLALRHTPEAVLCA